MITNFIIGIAFVYPLADEEAARLQSLEAVSIVSEYDNYFFKATQKNAAGTMVSKVFVSGEKFWHEYTTVQPIGGETEEEHLARIERIRKASGCDLPFYNVFDGSKTYEFNPFDLELVIRPSPRPRGSQTYLTHVGWVRVNNVSVYSFESILNRKIGKNEKWTAKGMNWQIDYDTEKDAYKRIELELGADSDFLPTRYVADGGVVARAEARFQWKEQSGRWFVERGETKLGGKPFISWEVKEISFDPARLPKSFSSLEKLVPYGTKIRVVDSRGRTVKERYKGGEKAEVEHRLRKMAVIKVRS